VKNALSFCDLVVNGGMGAAPFAEHCAVPPNAIADQLALSRGTLRVEITLRPFSFTVRRDGRRLLRSAGLWVADGTAADQFVQLTEGVIAHEDRAPAERALHARVISVDDASVQLAIGLHGGRAARARIELRAAQQLGLELEAAGEPLRLGFDWDRRSGERLVGLGLRHNPAFDQAGRNVQLGADRRPEHEQVVEGDAVVFGADPGRGRVEFQRGRVEAGLASGERRHQHGYSAEKQAAVPALHLNGLLDLLPSDGEIVAVMPPRVNAGFQVRRSLTPGRPNPAGSTRPAGSSIGWLRWSWRSWPGTRWH